MMTPILIPILMALGLAFAILVMIFILVPILKGIGWLIGGLFTGIGWVFAHIFEFIFGMIGDTVRFIGATLAIVVFSLLTVLNVVIGRWSAAGHFASFVKNETRIGGGCLYRVALRRPLKLVMMHGLLEGLEQRVPEAVNNAPTADRPRRRTTGTFDGYTIVGSLRGGGSGAKLYIAEPDASMRERIALPERVVIKSFTISDGSSLPQIIRESRALESAKKLGHVLDHGMDDHRFFYVMPYHPGDHLGIVTRQLHGESGGNGLDRRRLNEAVGYATDLLSTLSAYHRGGLWHKDVKPENIIVHDSHAHLVDLGLVTPLRSAMTLTTHGTEYFRDPEMVRQALRGVKVHQVDGGKFDVYAAGAVLYFLLENTFPAHGGLSRLTKRSPESLRWIVRRSMADYSKRYDSADLMLADLEYVAASADPFAVKPAQLPSMRGASYVPPVAEPEPEPDVVAAAGSPVPPPLPDEAVAAALPAAERPNLRVANWWTGAYVVDDGSAPEPFRGVEHSVEEAAAAAAAASVAARRSARDQLRSARARAKDMRRRVHDRRNKVRNRSVDTRRPSGPVILVSSLALIGLLGSLGVLFASVVRRPHHSPESWASSAAAEDRGTILVISDIFDDDGAPVVSDAAMRMVSEDLGKQGVVMRHPELAAVVRPLWDLVDAGDDHAELELDDILRENGCVAAVEVTSHRREGRVDTTRSRVHVVSSPEEIQDCFDDLSIPGPPVEGLRIVLVNTHPSTANLDVLERVEDAVHQYRDAGYDVVTNDFEATAAVEIDIEAWWRDQKGAPNGRVEATLADYDYYGVLWIRSPEGTGPASERFDAKLIYSEADDAETRIGEPVAAADSAVARSAG